MSNQKYYVDVQGNYIGSFENVDPPAGAIEVPFAPDHAFQKWNGTGYDALDLNDPRFFV